MAARSNGQHICRYRESYDRYCNGTAPAKRNDSMHGKFFPIILGCFVTAGAVMTFGCIAETPESDEVVIDDTLETLSYCNATAYCYTTGGSVSCSGNSSCYAQDQNCASSVRGKVTCDGVTTYCSKCLSPPPPSCDPSCNIVCGPTGGVCNNGHCNCY